VAVDRRGAVLVADDVGKRMWRIGPARLSAARSHHPVDGINSP
jgi:hypothetical protein